MRYMHGNDDQSDRVFAYVRYAYCIVMVLLIGYVIYLDCKVIQTNGGNLILMLGTLLLIGILSVCILRVLWMNRKYSVSAEGILIKTTLTHYVITWDMIYAVNYTPLLTGKHIFKDYILIFISSKVPQTFLEFPDLEYCWLNDARIVPIRYTEERSSELKELCPSKFNR